MFKLDWGLLLLGLCDVVLSLGSDFDGGGCRGGFRAGMCFVCALMRALAGRAGLPCALHLKEVT